MTLLSELIDIPTEVHQSDFVICLATAVHDPAGTLRDYVVIPQLADCFDRAISLVASAVACEPAARSLPELASVVAKHAPPRRPPVPAGAATT